MATGGSPGAFSAGVAARGIGGFGLCASARTRSINSAMLISGTVVSITLLVSFRFKVGYEREKTKTQLRVFRAVGSKISKRPQPYCFCVVALKEPGVVFPISEFPWNDSMVPPFREIPVVFCAIILSEMRIAEVLLA